MQSHLPHALIRDRNQQADKKLRASVPRGPETALAHETLLHHDAEVERERRPGVGALNLGGGDEGHVALVLVRYHDAIARKSNSVADSPHEVTVHIRLSYPLGIARDLE